MYVDWCGIRKEHVHQFYGCDRGWDKHIQELVLKREIYSWLLGKNKKKLVKGKQACVREIIGEGEQNSELASQRRRRAR